jgi:hypothetical protein
MRSSAGCWGGRLPRAAGAAAALWLVFADGGAIALAGASSDAAPQRPIISELAADRDRFDGRVVIVYGLVVALESGETGSFMLQDVSQRRIRVTVETLRPVGLHDQVEVEGVFRRGGAGGTADRIQGTRLERVKVLGGGGCC